MRQSLELPAKSGSGFLCWAPRSRIHPAFLSNSRRVQPHLARFPEPLCTVNWLPVGQRDIFASPSCWGQEDGFDDLWSPLPIPFQTLGPGGLEPTAVGESWHYGRVVSDKKKLSCTSGWGVGGSDSRPILWVPRVH